jgi:hypothetical protein
MGDRKACIRFGVMIGENRERRVEWRRLHPRILVVGALSASPQKRHHILGPAFLPAFILCRIVDQITRLYSAAYLRAPARVLNGRRSKYLQRLPIGTDDADLEPSKAIQVLDVHYQHRHAPFSLLAGSSIVPLNQFRVIFATADKRTKSEDEKSWTDRPTRRVQRLKPALLLLAGGRRRNVGRGSSCCVHESGDQDRCHARRSPAAGPPIPSRSSPLSNAASNR